MSEDFLHYIWKFQLFDVHRLFDSEGRKIQVLDQGTLNFYAGPDFKQVKVVIGEVLWSGHVEIHVRASDWYRHQHQVDQRYDNVVLHVVFENDQKVYRTDQTLIPVLELQPLIQTSVLNATKEETLVHPLRESLEIPCQRYLNKIQPEEYSRFIDRLGLERLHDRVEGMKIRAKAMDKDQFVYEQLARGFGLRLNSEAMGILAESLPYRILRQYNGYPFQQEALLFGQAGMLEGSLDDTYSQGLKEEYSFLQQKYRLEQRLNAHQWHFSGVRPSAYPTVRIAQFARLIPKLPFLIRNLEQSGAIPLIRKILVSTAGDYWKVHHQFGKFRKRALSKAPQTSGAFLDRLMVNVVIPMLVLKNPGDSECVSMLLKEIAPENNAITKFWNELGFANKHALHSQGLLQLNQKYCDQKQCLFCNIGRKILHRS